MEMPLHAARLIHGGNIEENGKSSEEDSGVLELSIQTVRVLRCIWYVKGLARGLSSSCAFSVRWLFLSGIDGAERLEG